MKIFYEHELGSVLELRQRIVSCWLDYAIGQLDSATVYVKYKISAL